MRGYPKIKATSSAKNGNATAITYSVILAKNRTSEVSVWRISFNVSDAHRSYSELVPVQLTCFSTFFFFNWVDWEIQEDGRKIQKGEYKRQTNDAWSKRLRCLFWTGILCKDCFSCFELESSRMRAINASISVSSGEREEPNLYVCCFQRLFFCP